MQAKLVAAKQLTSSNRRLAFFAGDLDLLELDSLEIYGGSNVVTATLCSSLLNRLAYNGR